MRAQPLHGANRHGGDHLQRHGSRPSHQPFDEIECQIGPKIPHDPASFVAGAPPGSAGQKKKMEKPRPSPAGPQKNPSTQLSAHANILGSPAQGGLKNAKLPHRSGRAIETAHDETPETKISRSGRNSLCRRVSIGLLQPNWMRCLWAISQLRQRVRRRVSRARTAVMRKRRSGLRLRPIHPTSYCLKQFSRCHFRKCGCGRSDIL